MHHNSRSDTVPPCLSITCAMNFLIALFTV